MGVLKPRTRLISFRLSEEEYERLKAACGAHGARSLSDFVRSGICWIIGNSNRGLFELIAGAGSRMPLTTLVHGAPPQPGPQTGDSGAVTVLSQRMEALAREVRRLSLLVQQRSPGETDSPAGAPVRGQNGVTP